MAQTKVEFLEAAGVSYNNPTEHYSVGAVASRGSYTEVALKFPVISGDLRFKRINSVNLLFYVNSYSYSASSIKLYAWGIRNDFDVNSVTYSQIDQYGFYDVDVYRSSSPGWAQFVDDFKYDIIVKSGILLDAPSVCTYYTPYGEYKPYLLIDHEEEVAGIEPYNFSPTSYATQSVDQSFSWTFGTSGLTIETLSPTSTKFQWRQNESSQINEIDANNGLSVTVPAGTFPSGTIQARVTVTANSGVTKSTQWYTIQVLPPRIDSPTPSSGYVPKYKDTEFNWSLVQPTSQTAKVQATQLSAVFKWRENADGVVHEITVSGPETRVTVPSGTFTADSIQWMVTATASGNVTASSDWMTCTTLETTSTAKAISPKSTVIQSGADITFAWEHIISTGSAPTGYDIQYSTDQILWLDILSGKTSETTAVLANNTLPGGTVYWHVRTYNTDGLAGAWSDPAEIIVIAPPAAPVITLEQISPRPIIRWTATDQAAYELEIVDVGSVARYGSENRYQTKSILPDGLHTVRVRIQNRYSQWSAWAEASFTIFNTPGGSISLSALAAANGDVSLSWSQGAFTGYEVLRDGVVIARTDQAAYTDRWAVGQVQYQVRGIVDAAGNYSLSNAVALAVSVRTVQIAPVSGGDWLALPYTTTDIREVATSVSRAVTYQQFLGAQLPTATVSDALTISHQLSTALPWSRKADANRLEAMIGQLVCVKDPRGERFVGVLGSYSKTSSRFYIAYSLTITPVDWEEAST